VSGSVLRIAVIGAGNHSALHHGSALQLVAAAHPGTIELAAVCDLDAAKAEDYARQFGFARTFTDYRAMIAGERLDGLVTVTPPGLTAGLAADLLARGIPVSIEKPPAETAAGTRQLLETARKHRAPHVVSFNRRFIPAVAKAREWLAGQGEARSPLLVIGRMLRPARREKDFVTGTGIHLIDTVLSFTGAPRRIVTVRAPSAHAGRFLYNATLDVGGGRSAAIVISPDVGTEEETVEIHGSEYCIAIDTIRCTIRIVDRGREVLAWQPPADSPYAFSCGALGETEAFLQAIRDGKGFSPGLAESLLTMTSAEAIEAGGEAVVGP
jgi:myo-inositol 2-dehydrogenase/D-chiro-inositol 1-dehydrogenase